jgi:small-conductance mechanosensitive channel
MATTEKEVIRFFEDKITYHEKEAARFRSVLAALKQASAQKEPTEPRPSAQAPKKVKEPTRRKPLQIPEQFDINLSQSQKIAFVLNETADITADDIASRIAELQQTPDDKEKIKRNISGVLTAMTKRHDLTYRKSGRTFFFTLSQ